MQVGSKTFYITKVERDAEEGYWTARVGSVFHDRKYGSWQVAVRRTDGTEDRREALPVVAAELQKIVRRLEKGEKLTGDERVEWPTGENLHRPRRILRNGEPVDSPALAPVPKAAPLDPAMGPAEVAMERIQREKAEATR